MYSEGLRILNEIPLVGFWGLWLQGVGCRADRGTSAAILNPKALNFRV